MADFHSWEPKHKGPAAVRPGQTDPGPAAARAVCWMNRDNPRADTYVLLEMLGLLPDQDPSVRRSSIPLRDPDKENTVCTPRPATRTKKPRKPS